jgi:cell pole-organizing protein PopZ
MEEILSSIRRIIADEESDDSSTGEEDDLGAAVQARVEALETDDASLERPAEEDHDDEDVLELTKVVRDSGEVVEFQSERAAEPPVEEPEPAFDRDDRDQESGFAHHRFGEASQDDPYGKDEPVQRQPAQASELMSATAASVATGAFAKLSQALQRTPQEESIADASGRTVEQFVEDIVRPMLKDWLDEHLTPIVERLVEKEIQKISRRAEFN